MREDASTSSGHTTARHAYPLRLGDVLVSHGVVTGEQVEQALKLQSEQERGKLLGQILIDLGFVTSQQIASSLAASLGIPFVEIRDEMVNREVISALPKELLQKHNIVPLAMTDDWMTVAMEDFSNVFAVEEIARATDRQVQVLAATGDNLRAVRAAVMGEIERYSDGKAEVDMGQLVDELNDEEVTIVEEETDAGSDDLEVAATDSPVIKLVNAIIRSAVQHNASDIHIEPGEHGCRVRYRVDGELVEQMKPPLKLLPAVVSRIKIMSKLDISERRVPQDGGVRVMAFGRAIDLRVSTMPAKYGEKVVMRIIDNERTKLSLESLGFSTKVLKPLRDVISEPNGILLVTGPTGSGKSTTLYAALAEMLSEASNISTIEDPIEYNLKGVNQFQVNPKAGFTFAGALRALLRQDPDIIMVGEIRDAETAKLAAEAAMTGHFVLSTLHTNDAVSAVPRLINMGVEPYLVSAAVRGVLAQRLVRQICPHCRQEQALGEKMRAVLEQMSIDPSEFEAVYHGIGCSRCNNTGIAGRTGIHEMLVLDEAMLSDLAHDMSLRALRDAAAKNGFRTLLDDGLEKVKAGLITIEGLLGTVSRAAG